MVKSQAQLTRQHRSSCEQCTAEDGGGLQALLLALVLQLQQAQACQ
jgi:hypothetical protein